MHRSTYECYLITKIRGGRNTQIQSKNNSFLFCFSDLLTPMNTSRKGVRMLSALTSKARGVTPRAFLESKFIPQRNDHCHHHPNHRPTMENSHCILGVTGYYDLLRSWHVMNGGSLTFLQLDYCLGIFPMVQVRSSRIIADFRNGFDQGHSST